MEECRLEPEILAVFQTPAYEIKTVRHFLPLGMGAGERQAISLAVELGIPRFLTDDEKAMKKAYAHAILPVHVFRILPKTRDSFPSFNRYWIK